MKYYIPTFLLFFLFAIGPVSCPAQSAATLNFGADPTCMPNCSPNVINPYPGLGTDGLGGQSHVSPGRVYDGTQSSIVYGQGTSATYGNTYGNGYTTGVPATSAAGLSAMPLTSINAADFEEAEIGSPLIPAEGAELYLSRMPTEKRTGVFQKGNFNALWTPKGNKDQDTGMTQFDASLSFAVPLFKQDSPLVISPLFQAWLLDPKYDELYPRDKLYTTGVDFRWIKPIIRNKLTLDLGVTPLYSGTFHGKAKKALRFPAHVAAIWSCNPRLKFVLGVAYQDRKDDYNWMPMAGIIWTPSEDLNFELLIPRARISSRIRWFGCAAGDNKSDWLYAGFEFGGGSWREYSGDEKHYIDYRDLRALLGYERRTAFGMTLGFEVGYMFNRKFEYHADNIGIEPKDNVFIRLRTTF